MANNKTKREKDHHSNQLNRNTGTDGSNKENSKANANRSRQFEEAKKGK